MVFCACASDARPRCSCRYESLLHALFDSTKPMASNEAANEACLSEADGEAICIELEEDGCEHFTVSVQRGG